MSSNANSTKDYILSLGFAENGIKDNGDKYVVDGDIVFYKDTLYKTRHSLAKGTAETNQYGYGSYVTKSKIIIAIAPSMNSYLPHINAAISQWNNLGGRIYFSIYNGIGTYDIMINRDDNIGQTTCGLGSWPHNGNPGNEIKINVGLISNYSFNQIQRTICHELGHTIGFFHTNQPNANIIPNTPISDAFSLMNARECNYGSTVLSNYDIKAFYYLYPPSLSVSGPNYFCNNGTYTLTNITGYLPSGANINWVSTGDLSVSGSSTTNLVNIIGNNGFGNITANITTSQGESYSASLYNVFTGLPSYIPFPSFNIIGDINPTKNVYSYLYSMAQFPGAIKYTFYVDGSGSALLLGNDTPNPSVNVVFNNSGYYNIVAKVTTECGEIWLDSQQLEVYVND